VACHVAKVAQLATATWQNHATSTFWWGQRPFSNNFFFTGMFFKLFFTGTKIKTDQITRTKIIFKPSIYILKG